MWPIKGREEHSTLFDITIFKNFTKDVPGERVYSDQCMAGADTRKSTQWYCNEAILTRFSERGQNWPLIDTVAATDALRRYTEILRDAKKYYRLREACERPSRWRRAGPAATRQGLSTDTRSPNLRNPRIQP